MVEVRLHEELRRLVLTVAELRGYNVEVYARLLDVLTRAAAESINCVVEHLRRSGVALWFLPREPLVLVSYVMLPAIGGLYRLNVTKVDNVYYVFYGSLSEFVCIVAALEIDEVLRAEAMRIAQILGVDLITAADYIFVLCHERCESAKAAISKRIGQWWGPLLAGLSAALNDVLGYVRVTEFARWPLLEAHMECPRDCREVSRLLATAINLLSRVQKSMK